MIRPALEPGCEYIPSLSAIRAGCLAVQSTWDATEEQRRTVAHMDDISAILKARRPVLTPTTIVMTDDGFIVE